MGKQNEIGLGQWSKPRLVAKEGMLLESKGVTMARMKSAIKAGDSVKDLKKYLTAIEKDLLEVRTQLEYLRLGVVLEGNNPWRNK